MSEEKVGTLDEALAHAGRLLGPRPDLAERQARDVLAVSPVDPRAQMLLGAALRRQDRTEDALAVLEPLARAQPRSAQTHLELGLTLAALSRTDDALAALRRAAELRPDWPDAWRSLADQLFLLGRSADADEAYARYVACGAADPALREAAGALLDGRLAVAERLLRERLKAQPSDVAAMRMLAEIGTRLGRNAEAEDLLEICLELAPSFVPARHNLALVLFRQQKALDALPHVEALRALDPAEPNWRLLHASCLGLVGEYARAAAIFEEALARSPTQPRVWLSLGHALRTEGRRAEAVAAYKRAVGLEPSLGDAYWSLANLKTERFSDDETAAMEAQLARPEIVGEDRFHLHYALGKDLEDRGEFPASFAHYAEGARLRRIEAPWDGEDFDDLIARSRALFTAEFFAERAGWGAESGAPIFVVGLPRSGSTLIEQILSSHSAVEGTMELPEIGAMAREFQRAHRRGRGDPYPDVLARLSREEIQTLGETFLERTKIHRKLGKPFFIDKMPSNFLYLGLIRLILPNARVVDARRHPMAACFSAFKQHFARGHAYSYDLDDLARFYRGYVALMAHFDAVQPGWVTRVIYEDMVDDTEAQVRRLLAALGLPFEPACLKFYETARAVRTASSEQVRRPIFREGLDQWHNYAQWLGPLAAGLAPVMESWRG